MPAIFTFGKLTARTIFRFGYWNTLGIAQYRAGDWAKAVAALDGAIERHNGGDGFDWILLAMCHWRLDHHDLARYWYDRAVGWMSQNKPHDEELRRFIVEASGLLGIPPPAPRQTPRRIRLQPPRRPTAKR